MDIAASYDRLSYVIPGKRRYLGTSQNDYQAAVVLTQPIYTGGRITSSKRSASHGLDAARQGYFAVRDDVVFNVKAAYFRLLFAKEIVKSKESLLRYAELSHRTAVDLNRRTRIPREETLLRLEVQVNETRQELISARDDLMISQKALLNAMGLDANGVIEVRDLKDDFAFTRGPPAEIAQNHEIVKISREIEEAEASARATKSSLYPQLGARASYGVEWSSFSTGDDTWTAGLTLGFNLLDWGKTRAEFRRAKAYQAELESYRDLRGQQLDLELESARLHHESATRRYEIARKSHVQARKSLDLFEGRYRDALATSVELLDAQRAFSQAQVNYALSKLDMRVAKAEIERIAGYRDDQ